jgi:DNA-binding CsgD family transcriptional regulator
MERLVGMDSQVAPIGLQGGVIGLTSVVSAIGYSNFEQTLLEFLNDFCGADHIFTGQCNTGKLQNIVSMRMDGIDFANLEPQRYLQQQYWLMDPLFDFCSWDVKPGLPLFRRLDSLELPRGEFRDVCFQQMEFRDRILICCGDGVGSMLTLNLVRSVDRGPFSGCDLAGLAGLGDVLMAVLERHNWIKQRRQQMGMALVSVEEVEHRCRRVGGFPRREAEVCARIVSGLTTKATAQQLGLGEQTVLTYRKRIYHRLNISSHHELVQWYLKLWSDDGEPTQAISIN